MRTLRWITRVAVNVPRPEVWRLASDTARINRAVGFPPIHFSPDATHGPGNLDATTRFLGIPLHWREHPFDWVYPARFSIVRTFYGTPIRSIRIDHLLEAAGETRTTIEVRVEVVPRTPLGWLLARLLVGNRLLRALAGVYRSFEQVVAVEVERLPALGPPEVRRAELHRLRARLLAAPVDRGLVERLVTFLEQAPDDAVTGLRPFALAVQWRAPRLEVLRLCLWATRHGLLELSWEVLCPNCRVAKAIASTLGDLQGTAHCETCQIVFDATFDEYVELRFAVSPAVRSTSSATYCIGGPGNARHVLAQCLLPPSARHPLSLVLQPGTYRLRGPGLTGCVDLAVRPGVGVTQVEVLLEAGALSPAEAVLLPGPATLLLRNADATPHLLMLEETSRGTEYATAALVTSLQEFRDLFSGEVLAPGLGLAIRNLTLLFTDLKGSTALYETIGDAPAFARVRDHFTVLTQAIAQHEGALVKTIGDAVMAVFTSTPRALAASLAIHAGIAALNAANPAAPPLRVKVGLHRGPCIAVTANGMLDYFGTTVNTAARVEGAAPADEILVTSAVLDDAEAAALIADRGLPVLPLVVELRGLSGTVNLHRICPPQPDAIA